MEEKDTEQLPEEEESKDERITPAGWGYFFIGILAMAVVTFLVTLKTGEYGWTLFMLLPALMGLLIGFLWRPTRSRSLFARLGYSLVILLGLGALAIITGIEGGICVIMALPFMYAPLSLGLVVGYLIRRYDFHKKVKIVLFMFLLQPAGLAYDITNDTEIDSTVITSIEIDAPVEAVWQTLTNSVSFGESERLFFRAGVIYPRDMCLLTENGQRYLQCNSNNGLIRFRVTSMKPNEQLRFELAHEIEPMKELSPYGELDAPHLRGYFHAGHGQFTLIPTGRNTCRLEAETGYKYRLKPVFYWKLWTDHLIDGMHRQVLEGLRSKVESRK